MGVSSSFLSQNPLVLLASILPAWIAGAFLILSFRPAIYDRIKPWRTALVVLAYVITRLVLFYIAFVVMSNRPNTGDIRWFQWEGLGALAGKLPYRDFKCLHSPLFPYLMAIPYGIWRDVASSILVFILFDLLSLGILCKIVRATIGPEKVADTVWLYVINPVTWVITVRYGQDETIISFFLLLAVYVYLRKPQWWYGVILALGVLMTKFTTAAGMFVVYTYSKAKLRDAAVAIALLAATFLPFYLKGADVLQPATYQKHGIVGIGLSNLLRVTIVPPHYYILFHNAVTILTVLAFCITLYIGHRKGLSIMDNLTACLLVFLIFVPVSYRFYRVWVIGPLGVRALRTKQILRYVIYSVLLCTCDDFGIEPGTPPAVLYTMVAIAAVILVMELGYVRQIISGSPKPVQSPVEAAL